MIRPAALFTAFTALLALAALSGGCAPPRPDAHIEITFAGEGQPPAAQQALVRRNLHALWSQVTGQPPAPTPRPDLPRLRLVWETAPGRVVLSAAVAGDGTRPRRYTLRRGDTDLRRHLGVAAFLRQVHHDLPGPTP